MVHTLTLRDAAFKACAVLEEMRDSPDVDYFPQDADEAICDINKALRNTENDRLAAAAPELYEALTNLLLEGEFNDYPGTRQWKAVKAAISVIEKVIGKPL